jgi:hypothetical protein
VATSTYTPLGTYNDSGLTAEQKAQIDQYKKDWADAQAKGDVNGMNQAHANAENVRATAFGNSGYSGGSDGSDYIAINNTRGGQTGSNLTGLLNQLNPYGVSPTTPQTSGLALGDQYGINYDYNSILGILNNATKSSYDAQWQQQQQTQNNFYNDLYATQGTTLDTLRQAQAKAIATGASKGMSAANELSSILNLQTTAAKSANDLANTSNNLSAQQQAATAANASTALNTSNSLKQAIGQLDMTKYGYDVQNSIGVLDYLSSLAQTAGGIIDSENNLAGTKYNADQNLAGTKYNADYGYGGSKNKYYGQSTENTGGSYYGGGGGYTGGGGGGGGNGSTNTGKTTTPTASGQAGQPIALSYSNSSIQRAADGSWTLNTYDANGKPTQITGLTDAQKTAVVMEGDPDVLNKGYQDSIWKGNPPDIHNGSTVKVGGTTYTYNSIKNLWYSPTGTPWGARNLKGLRDRVGTTAPASSGDISVAGTTWSKVQQPGMVPIMKGDDGTQWYAYPD